MNSPAKVSVVMSVYNGIPYLQESVESILNQSFTNFEFIIIDDCSTDNSWEILSQYAEQDKRIKLHQNQDNLGLTKSLNKALNLATGEYIARQDADDVSLPKRFEKQVALLNQHPDYVLASCDIELIDAEGATLSTDRRACEPGLVAWYLLFYNHIAGHSQVMYKKQPVIDLGGYLSSRRYSQDYELWCRLAKVGQIAILPEVLMKQRRHGGSISADKKSDQEAYSLNQSKTNIEQLIDEEITLEEVQALREFWLYNRFPEHLYFPDSQKFGNVHLQLKKIYQAFFQQDIYSVAVDSKLPKTISKLIGEQFLFWIQAPITKRHGLKAKIKVSRYAFFWHPLGLSKSWLISLLWASPPNIFRAMVRRLNRQKASQANLRS